jgi:DNA-binding GntR family transcriptional regulator
MLSAAEFSEILEMRLSLECLALDLAAPAFTEADLKGALEIVNRTQSEINRTKVLDLRDEFESRWGHLNWEFHRRLYAPANRPRLLSTIENLNLLFARHLRARIARQDQTGVKSTPSNDAAANLTEWTAVLEEHRSMAIACGKHDAKAAKVILRRHISDHGAELVGRLRAISKDIASL